MLRKSAEPALRISKQLLTTWIGTAIEFFDFYSFATAAVIVFPRLFFPASDPATATLPRPVRSACEP